MKGSDEQRLEQVTLLFGLTITNSHKVRPFRHGIVWAPAVLMSNFKSIDTSVTFCSIHADGLADASQAVTMST